MNIIKFLSTLALAVLFLHTSLCAQSTDELYEQVGTAFLHDNEEQAEDLLRQILALDGNDVDAWNALGHLYYWKEEYAQAETYYLQAFTLDSKYVATLMNLGKLYYLQGKSEEAEQYGAQALLSVDSDNVEHLMNFALFLYLQGKTDEAEHYYIQASSTEWVVYYWETLFPIIKRSFDEKKAKWALLQRLVADPNDKSTLLSMGITYYNEQNYAQAERYFLQVLAIDARELRVLVLLGMNSRSQRKLEEAEQYFLQALAVDPYSSTALYELAEISFHLDKHEEAEQYWLTFLSIASKDSYLLIKEARRNLARLYEKQGRYNEAEAYYLQVLELDPNNRNALAGLSRVRSEFHS